MSEPRSTLVERAARLMKIGPVAAAVAAHRALLDAYPDDPNSWYNLSLLERRARRPLDALTALDEALARQIEGPEEVWLQRAVVLSEDLGNANDARAALERALVIAPRYLPALLNLGNLEEDVGRRAEAEACYRTALAVVPRHPLVLARLLGVATLSGGDDPLIATLRSTIEQVADMPLAEADLGFALGAALDRLEDYDAAFDAYVLANRASRRFALSRGQRYDRSAKEQWVERLIGVPLPPVEGSGEKAPLFVCGMVRSGSTLAEQLLGRHPAFAAGGEIGAIPAIAAETVPYPEAVGQLGAEDRIRLAARYSAETAHLQIDGQTLIDKRPDNVFHLPLIRTLFPEARIVRTVRGALDNALSAFFLHADPILSWATDLDDIAHYLGQERRLAAHMRETAGDKMYELQYERLVDNKQSELEALLAFCDVQWDARVLDPEAGKGGVRTASVWQVREPIHQRSVGRWQNYAHRLGNLPEKLEGLT